MHSDDTITTAAAEGRILHAQEGYLADPTLLDRLIRKVGTPPAIKGM